MIKNREEEREMEAKEKEGGDKGGEIKEKGRGDGEGEV